MIKEKDTKTEREKLSDLYFLKLGKFADTLTAEQVGDLIDLLNTRDRSRA